MQRRSQPSLLLLFLISAACIAHAESNPLEALVQTSAHRLQLATKVALAKWDSGASVEDPVREKQVIDNAVREGQSRNLDPAQVEAFFRAQIEANKVIQYSLLSNWFAAGSAPPHGPIDLAGEIRPQLDEIQKELIEELADTASLRSDASCPRKVARAIDAYLKTEAWERNSRPTVAIQRALGATCAR
jgi:chorismate mutase